MDPTLSMNTTTAWLETHVILLRLIQVELPTLQLFVPAKRSHRTKFLVRVLSSIGHFALSSTHFMLAEFGAYLHQLWHFFPSFESINKI